MEISTLFDTINAYIKNNEAKLSNSLINEFIRIHTKYRMDICSLYYSRNRKNIHHDYFGDLYNVSKKIHLQTGYVVNVKKVIMNNDIIIKYNICCGEYMRIDYVLFCYVCCTCGADKNITGNMVNECAFKNNSQAIYTQINTRNGSFDPSKHFKHWMQHILGKEPKTELGTKKVGNYNGELLIKQIQVYIKQNNIRDLTVDNIRIILKKLKKTNYNKNTTLILKLLTNKKIPIITDDIFIETSNLFNRVVDVQKSLTDIKSNRTYYPYYIYKILDILLEDKEILDYIHLQSSNTIYKSDKEWEKICEQIDELTYKKTII